MANTDVGGGGSGLVEEEGGGGVTVGPRVEGKEGEEVEVELGSTPGDPEESDQTHEDTGELSLSTEEEVGEVQEVIGDGGEEPVVGGEFADDMFGVPAAREKKTRSQKRRGRRVHGLVRAKDGPSRGRQSEDALDLSPEELQRLQETDDTLEGVVEGDRVFRRNGVLYRRWVPRGQPEEAVTEQLVLPKQCRRTVLQLAHSIPLGGHLGKKKTADRVLKRFYWPSLYRDVADFCRSCSACQKSGRRRVPASPMVPLQSSVSRSNGWPWTSWAHSPAAAVVIVLCWYFVTMPHDIRRRFQ